MHKVACVEGYFETAKGGAKLQSTEKEGLQIRNFFMY